MSKSWAMHTAKCRPGDMVKAMTCGPYQNATAAHMPVSVDIQTHTLCPPPSTHMHALCPLCISLTVYAGLTSAETLSEPNHTVATPPPHTPHEVLLQPQHSAQVQVVGGLIQQQQRGLDVQRTSKTEGQEEGSSSRQAPLSAQQAVVPSYVSHTGVYM
jgi:hypothetical protein